MKDYNEMAQSVLSRRDKYVIKKRKQMKIITTVVSCFCLVAIIGLGGRIKTSVGSEHGTVLEAASQGVVQNQSPTSQGENYASEEGSDYQAESSIKNENKELSVDKSVHGAPVWSATDLTLEALYNEVGYLLPENVPEGFMFESASFSEYGYSVIWYNGLDELNWRIRDYKDEDAKRITSIEDIRNYDLALYPIPRADSVPEELREIVDNSIFRAEDLTQEVVYARAYKINEAGDSDGYRMNFSVLYGEKVISITSKGISPEWIFTQLCALPRNFDAPVQNEAGITDALIAFDDVWGGSYINENGNWVVWLTEDTSDIRAEVFKQNPYISENKTEFRKADYSLAYLTQLLDDISKAMSENQLPFVSSAALREDINRIEVFMTDENTEYATKVQSFDTIGGAIEFKFGILTSTDMMKEIIE